MKAETVDRRLGMDLRDLAKKYIWWMTPEQAMENPKRVMAQVMNLGTYQDWGVLKSLVDDDTLRSVLREAKAGWFTPKRWNFWHIHLKACDPYKVPPLPKRPLPPNCILLVKNSEDKK